MNIKCFPVIGKSHIKALVSFCMNLFANVSILYPICVPRPSGTPLKSIMLGILSLGNVIPSYLPKKISNLPELLISLNENFGKATVLLMVANNFGTVSKAPGMKANRSPFYGRYMTLAPELLCCLSSKPLKL